MKKLTTEEIRLKLAAISSPDDPFLNQCRNDERKSVIKLADKWTRDYEQQLEKKQQFEDMMIFEKKARGEGYHLLCGIDEVGRGPLAGPVVAAAVILPESFYLPGLTDSKKLTAAKRESFYEFIVKEAIAFGVGIVSPAEIDRLNIYQATKAAMVQAVKELSVAPEYLLIDAMKLSLPIPQESLIKGDARSVSIAAASVLAKVTRDRMMMQLAAEYPQYGFEQNMGYGTKQHLEALNLFGVTECHRRSFSPVKEMAAEETVS